MATPSPTFTDPIGGDVRAELLAAADADGLVRLAEQLIERLGEPVISPPETGLVLVQAREPACRDRFQLGEVVVTRAEVLWTGAAGWAMRHGTDRVATLAAAMCDAAAAFDDASGEAVAELCRRTREQRLDAAEAERSARSSTVEIVEGPD